MALLSFPEEWKRSTEGATFAKRSEADHWMDIWCVECVHRGHCPLLSVSLTGRTPEAWTEREGVTPNKYTCREFTQDEAQKL